MHNQPQTEIINKPLPKVGRPKRPPRQDGITFIAQPVRSKYVGEVRIMACGNMARCLSVRKLRGNIRLTIQWLNDNLVQEIWMSSFQRRSTSHPKAKTVYGVGYLGVNHPPIIKENIPCYTVWKDKCAFHKEGTSVLCDEWQDFSVFHRWYTAHVVPKQKAAKKAVWCLETDLSTVYSGGKKIYSPQTVHVLPFNANISLARFMEAVQQLKPLLDMEAKEVTLPTAINHLKEKDRLRLKIYGNTLYFAPTPEGRREAAIALLDYRHSELMRHAEAYEKYILPSTMIMLRTLRDTYSRNLGIITIH